MAYGQWPLSDSVPPFCVPTALCLRYMDALKIPYNKDSPIVIHHVDVYVDYILTLQSALFLFMMSLGIYSLFDQLSFQLKRSPAMQNFSFFSGVLVYLAPGVQLSDS